MTRNNQMARRAAVDNRSHQQMLAQSLVASLGLEGAIHACQANCWDGVLDVVLAQKAPGATIDD